MATLGTQPSGAGVDGLTRTMPPTRADLARIRPTLVYWCGQCGWYVPLADGPDCPGTEIHRMRKRRAWICTYCAGSGYEEQTGWLHRAAFLVHHEEG